MLFIDSFISFEIDYIIGQFIHFDILSLSGIPENILWHDMLWLY